MSATSTHAQASTALRAGLWIAQVLLAAMFIMSGLMKGLTPIPELVKSLPWAGDYSVTFVRSIAVIDLAGGIGILLPALTRILPRLTVLAALGCAVLQVFAMVFHLSRGEWMVLPVNLVLFGLSVFVFWGRSRKVPILPHHSAPAAA